MLKPLPSDRVETVHGRTEAEETEPPTPVAALALEIRRENALNGIAALVGADPRDPIGVFLYVRERLRALERSERRMLALEKRLELVRAAADGDPEIKRITITRRIAPPVTIDEDVE